ERVAAGKWNYLYISPSVERLTGRPVSHFLNRLGRWEQAIDPDDSPAWQQALRRLREGQASQGEDRVQHADGRARWGRENVRLTRRTDGVLQLHGVLTDITDRKELEQTIAQLRADLAHCHGEQGRSPLTVGRSSDRGWGRRKEASQTSVGLRERRAGWS